MKKLNEKKRIILIFTISMVFCLIIGIMLTYNFDFNANFNLLFESDSSRVINDMSELIYNHYRLKVHPLFVLFTQPVYFIVKGLVMNKMLSLVLISSFVTSLTSVYIYKLLSIYSNNYKLKYALVAGYVLSFSNIVFTAGIEIYNIAVLFLLILWYYILSRNKFNRNSYIILVILGVMSVAFTVTNIVIFLIALFVLWIYKKVKLRYLITIFLSTLLISVGLIYFQNLIWHNTPTIGMENYQEEKNFIETSIGFDNVKNVIRDDYYNSMVSSDVHVIIDGDNKNFNGTNYIMQFDDIGFLNNLVLTAFYLSFIVLIIRNFSKNKMFNTGFCLALLFNTGLHTIYGNSSLFLYSLHFIYLIIGLYGVNLLSEENNLIKKIGKYVLILFVSYELIVNCGYFIKVLNITKTILNSNYFVANLGLFESFILLIVLLSILLFLVSMIVRFIKKYKKSKTKEEKVINIIIVVGLSLLIHCIFIGLETAKTERKILWIKLGDKSGVVYPNENNEYIKIDKKGLSSHFKEEMKALNEYVAEYKEFLKKYDHKEVDFLNSGDYYFLGLGNRRKLLYKNGDLIDVDTSEKIYSFKVKSSQIIPNLYMVILETDKGNYVKIYEDEYGVHCNVDDNDVLVNGTGKYLNLYKFENQKYQNIKKVLYSEILFNIKDSVIYPNIIVYDSPWYRDAALATMVLKQTNNLDLISDWVDNIKDIYDYQNKGNKEPDNLGELLYILSTQKKNDELVNKIIKEANSIAKKNPNGYYLYGLTDYSNHSVYQNLWYKLGITANGKKYDFANPNEEDGYAPLAWWSDNPVDNRLLVSGDVNYPYLSLAAYHKQKRGEIAVNKAIYPLSWERSASEAKYYKMSVLDDYYSNNGISPLHVWTASEFLLLLLDETGDMK